MSDMHASTEFYEASMNILVNGVKRILICGDSSKPTTVAGALANVLAMSTTVSSTDLVSVSATSGITLTVSSNVALISASTLESTGIAKFICMLSTVAGAKVYYITSCTTKKLSSGDTVTMPAWTITVSEPTS
jgi:hypothetical protein